MSGKFIDTVEFLYWRRLFRILLIQTNPQFSIKAQKTKLKLSYFVHIMPKIFVFFKSIVVGKLEGRRKRGESATKSYTAVMDAILEDQFEDIILQKIYLCGC